MHFTKATANFTGAGNQVTADLNQCTSVAYSYYKHTLPWQENVCEKGFIISLLLSRAVFGNAVKLPSSQAQTLTLLAIQSHLKPLGKLPSPSSIWHPTQVSPETHRLQPAGLLHLPLQRGLTENSFSFSSSIFIPPSSVYAHIQICGQEHNILRILRWYSLLYSVIMTYVFQILKPIYMFIIYAHIHVNHNLYC